MYLFFDISSAQSCSFYFYFRSRTLCVSLSLHAFHIPTFPCFRFFLYTYCSGYLCHTLFVTHFWHFFWTIYPSLHLTFVRLYFFNPQWHCYSINLYVWLFSYLSIFLSHLLRLNCFIAFLPLFLFMLLPHSLPMYLPQTTFISLHLSLSLALSLFYSPFAIILLLFLHISLSRSLSVSLAQPLTILHFILPTLFLSFLHSCYNVIIIVTVFFLFCFFLPFCLLIRRLIFMRNPTF